MLSIQEHKYTALYSGLCGALFGLGLLSAIPQAAASIPQDNSSAVIFLYQRIGEDTLPQSSISVEQFKEHIRELKTDGYTVLPLGRIIHALKNGDTLPQKTVALTLEGGWQSTAQTAIPLLLEAELPFTLFIASDMADGSQPNHMDWKELKNLKRHKLVELGILPAAYVHMTSLSAEENAGLINRAVSTYRDALGEEPLFFAYPYGEYSKDIRAQVATYPFLAAFALQSGVTYSASDFMTLPRFIMTDMYGDIDRFRLTANALPLPVTDAMPDNMVLAENPPLIGFTVAPELSDLSRLSCFISGLGKAGIFKPGGNRVEIRLEEPLQERRTRINCTMPDDTIIPGEPQSWRWFGMQLVADDVQDDVTDMGSGPIE
jgi:poly-beta-1,6-N-acetyl-D-glucosamine N-deacetylase